MASRRSALKTAAGAVAILPVLGQQHDHVSSGAAPAAYKPKWATAAEMKLLAEACDAIIPRTDTPGASDAKVPEYIDYSLARNERRIAVLRDGLKWFAALKPTDRVAAFQKASEKPQSREGRFFTMLKGLTIDGYYQSREGLVQELGWNGNTALAEFKGCTHPEHQS